MTTKIFHPEDPAPHYIAKANELLDELGPVSAEELTRPFIAWLGQLHKITDAMEASELPMTDDDDLQARVEALLAELSRAADLVEAAAMCVVTHDWYTTASGVRTFFEAVTRAPLMRLTLHDSDLATVG